MRLGTAGSTTPDDGFSPVYSADGTKVAYASDDSSLVSGDTNGAADIFVKDLETGAVTRVSTAADGAQANGRSHHPVFSTDGTKLAFVSEASNLVAGDTNGAADIFVKDLDTGAVTRVSTAADGTQSDGASNQPLFLPDGATLVFASQAGNLIADDTNGVSDIFAKDLVTGAVLRLSDAFDGTEANGASVNPSLTPDGARLTFTSSASNLVADDTNGIADLFLRDLVSTPIRLIQDKPNQMTAKTGGRLLFTDPDLGDTHTVTVKPADGAVGHLTARVAVEPHGGSGAIDWVYTVDHKAVQSLTTCQTKVDSFTVTVDDGHGSPVSQVVSVTVRGSAPASSSAAGKHDTSPPGTGSGQDHTGTTGTITVNHAPQFGQSGLVERLSTDSGGHQIKGRSFDSTLSADGNILVFTSDADDLVPGDTNKERDVFLKDLRTGAVSRVSVTADGTQLNGGSYEPHLSPDGTNLLFTSYAPGIVPTDAFSNNYLFLKNLKTGALTPIGSILGEHPATFSPDGTQAIFASADPNLVPGDTNNASDIFARDIATGTVTRLSTTSDGKELNYYSYDPRLSPDGTKLVFFSNASNVVPDDANKASDIFVKDLTTGAVTRVSTSSDGKEANSSSNEPTFSPDGTKVAFMSWASNLVPGDTNKAPDIFVKDLATGAITRVNTRQDGSQLPELVNATTEWTNGYDEPVFSPDGTKIAFRDQALSAIYIKDLTTGALTTMPLAQGTNFAFTADSSELVFVSGDNSLVTGDTNGALDIFKARIDQTTTGLVHDKADQATSSTSGVLPFTDLDAGDTHTVTVTPGVSVVGTLTAKVTKEPGGKTGTIAWDYRVDHKAVESLAQDKTKVDTFTVTLDDGHGGAANQTVTVTVYGSASASASAAGVQSASTALAESPQHHTDTLGTMSTGPTETAPAASLHVLDTHHGLGLTGFEA